jgi:hypothetical protein
MILPQKKKKRVPRCALRGATIPRHRTVAFIQPIWSFRCDSLMRAFEELLRLARGVKEQNPSPDRLLSLCRKRAIDVAFFCPYNGSASGWEISIWKPEGSNPSKIRSPEPVPHVADTFRNPSLRAGPGQCGGAGGIRTHEWRFCRPLPLASWVPRRCA